MHCIWNGFCHWIGPNFKYTLRFVFCELHKFKTKTTVFWLICHFGIEFKSTTVFVLHTNELYVFTCCDDKCNVIYDFNSTKFFVDKFIYIQSKITRANALLKCHICYLHDWHSHFVVYIGLVSYFYIESNGVFFIVFRSLRHTIRFGFDNIFDETYIVLSNLLFITVKRFMNFSVCSRVQSLQEKSIHVENVWFFSVSIGTTFNKNIHIGSPIN